MELTLPRGNCAYCGKEIPVKDIRSTRAQYCSRPHASMGRYAMRYRGTNSGQADRPDFDKKLKEL